MDIMEERESQLRAMSRATKTGPRMSIVGESGEPTLGGDLELDIEQLLADFPDETLIYMSQKHQKHQR